MDENTKIVIIIITILIIILIVILAFYYWWNYVHKKEPSGPPSSSPPKSPSSGPSGPIGPIPSPLCKNPSIILFSQPDYKGTKIELCDPGNYPLISGCGNKNLPILPFKPQSVIIPEGYIIGFFWNKGRSDFNDCGSRHGDPVPSVTWITQTEYYNNLTKYPGWTGLETAAIGSFSIAPKSFS
jgi:hypothetical protein